MKLASDKEPMWKKPPNTRLVLTNPDAAQSVLRPLCLLPGFAAQPHVRIAAFGKKQELASKYKDEVR